MRLYLAHWTCIDTPPSPLKLTEGNAVLFAHHWMAICRSSTCLNRFQASHKLYSVSRRLNRRKAPAPRMPSWKSSRNRASFSVSEKRSMMAHSWTSNLSGSVRYCLPSCSRMLRASLTASRCQSGNSSMTVCASSARSNALRLSLRPDRTRPNRRPFRGLQ